MSERIDPSELGGTTTDDSDDEKQEKSTTDGSPPPSDSDIADTASGVSAGDLGGGGSSSTSDSQITGTATDVSAGDLGGSGGSSSSDSDIAETAADISAGDLGGNGSGASRAGDSGGSSGGVQSGGSSPSGDDGIVASTERNDLSEQRRSEIEGQVVSNNTELFTTSSNDPDSGPLSPDDIRAERRADGKVTVELTESGQRALEQANQQDRLDKDLLAGAVARSESRSRQEQELAALNEREAEQPLKQLRGAANRAEQQQQQEQTLASMSSTGSGTGEQFGDRDWSFGFGGDEDEVEQTVDSASKSVSEFFGGAAEDIEQETEERASRARERQPAGALATDAAALEVGGELLESGARLASDASRTPSLALEAQELVSSSNELRSEALFNGENEAFEQRQQQSRAAAVAVAESESQRAQEQPVDVAADLVVGTAVGTVTTRVAGRASRPGPSTDAISRRVVSGDGSVASRVANDAARLRVRLAEEFSGTDRGQFGGGENVKTASEIFEERGLDTDAEGGSDAVEADGDQLMLTREVEVQQQRQPGDLTEEEASAAGEMELDAEAIREFAEGTDTEASVGDDLAASAAREAPTGQTEATAFGALGGVGLTAASQFGAQSGQREAIAFDATIGGAAPATATESQQSVTFSTDIGFNVAQSIDTDAAVATAQATGFGVDTRADAQADTETDTGTRTAAPTSTTQAEGLLSAQASVGSQTTRSDHDSASNRGRETTGADRSGGDSLLDDAVTSGFFAETTSAAAGNVLEARDPATENPKGVAALTGEVATEEQASGEAAAFTDLLSPGGGGEIGGSFGTNLFGGDNG